MKRKPWGTERFCLLSVLDVGVSRRVNGHRGGRWSLESWRWTERGRVRAGESQVKGEQGEGTGGRGELWFDKWAERSGVKGEVLSYFYTSPSGIPYSLDVSIIMTENPQTRLASFLLPALHVSLSFFFPYIPLYIPAYFYFFVENIKGVFCKWIKRLRVPASRAELAYYWLTIRPAHKRRLQCLPPHLQDWFLLSQILWSSLHSQAIHLAKANAYWSVRLRHRNLFSQPSK